MRKVGRDVEQKWTDFVVKNKVTERNEEIRFFYIYTIN